MMSLWHHNINKHINLLKSSNTLLLSLVWYWSSSSSFWLRTSCCSESQEESYWSYWPYFDVWLQKTKLEECRRGSELRQRCAAGWKVAAVFVALQSVSAADLRPASRLFERLHWAQVRTRKSLLSFLLSLCCELRRRCAECGATSLKPAAAAEEECVSVRTCVCAAAALKSGPDVAAPTGPLSPAGRVYLTSDLWDLQMMGRHSAEICDTKRRRRKGFDLKEQQRKRKRRVMFKYKDRRRRKNPCCSCCILGNLLWERIES